MSDPNLPLLEDAFRKLALFLDEIVFVGGATLGLLITDESEAAAKRFKSGKRPKVYKMIHTTSGNPREN